MRFRNGFVSNSSSSSYIIYWKSGECTVERLEKYMSRADAKKLLKRMEVISNYDDYKKYLEEDIYSEEYIKKAEAEGSEWLNEMKDKFKIYSQILFSGDVDYNDARFNELIPRVGEYEDFIVECEY